MAAEAPTPLFPPFTVRGWDGIWLAEEREQMAQDYVGAAGSEVECDEFAGVHVG
jgi:hypothetical protein